MKKHAPLVASQPTDLYWSTVYGYVMNAPKKLGKLFHPLGLANLKARSLIDVSPDGIDVRNVTEKDAARPFRGDLWIGFTLLWGHFNGPKQKIMVITDGEEVLRVDSSYYESINNRDKYQVDQVLKKYVLNQLEDIF